MSLRRTLAIAVALAPIALSGMGAPGRAAALHSFCVAPTPTCTDNGFITPTTSPSPHFGFVMSPNSGTDTFFLGVLIPNNASGADSENFSITGAHTGNATVSSALFSSTAWTSGFLDTYLGINAQPNNPIGAFLPWTQTLGGDPGATGYFAYLFNFGSVTFGSSSDPTFLSDFLFPEGTVIAGFANTPSGDWIATASSSVLIDTPVPEPASLLLLGMGLVGLGIARRRKA